MSYQSVADSRLERHLMRQRGTGARELKNAQFGFTFAVPSPVHMPPLPTLNGQIEPRNEEKLHNATRKSNARGTKRRKIDSSTVAQSEQAAPGGRVERTAVHDTTIATSAHHPVVVNVDRVRETQDQAVTGKRKRGRPKKINQAAHTAQTEGIPLGSETAEVPPATKPGAASRPLRTRTRTRQAAKTKPESEQRMDNGQDESAARVRLPLQKKRRTAVSVDVASAAHDVEDGAKEGNTSKALQHTNSRRKQSRQATPTAVAPSQAAERASTPELIEMQFAAEGATLPTHADTNQHEAAAPDSKPRKRKKVAPGTQAAQKVKPDALQPQPKTQRSQKQRKDAACAPSASAMDDGITEEQSSRAVTSKDAKPARNKRKASTWPDADRYSLRIERRGVEREHRQRPSPDQTTTASTSSPAAAAAAAATARTSAGKTANNAYRKPASPAPSPPTPAASRPVINPPTRLVQRITLPKRRAGVGRADAGAGAFDSRMKLEQLQLQQWRKESWFEAKIPASLSLAPGAAGVDNGSGPGPVPGLGLGLGARLQFRM